MSKPNLEGRLTPKEVVDLIAKVPKWHNISGWTYRGKTGNIDLYFRVDFTKQILPSDMKPCGPDALYGLWTYLVSARKDGRIIGEYVIGNGSTDLHKKLDKELESLPPYHKQLRQDFERRKPIHTKLNPTEMIRKQRARERRTGSSFDLI